MPEPAHCDKRKLTLTVYATPLMTPTTDLGLFMSVYWFELLETGDWDIFLGPPERERAENGGADQWGLKRREVPGFVIVNDPEKKCPHPWDTHSQFSIKTSLSHRQPPEGGRGVKNSFSLERGNACSGGLHHFYGAVNEYLIRNPINIFPLISLLLPIPRPNQPAKTGSTLKRDMCRTLVTQCKQRLFDLGHGKRMEPSVQPPVHRGKCTNAESALTESCEKKLIKNSACEAKIDQQMFEKFY